jgi:hypothetical protein
MPLTIRSRINIAESLRRGYPVQPDRDGRVAVTIPDDIGEEERRLIAAHLHQSIRDGVTIAAPTIAPELPEPTVAGIIEVIAAAERQREVERQRLAAERAAAVDLAAQIIRTRATRESCQTVYSGDVRREWVEIVVASPGTAYTDDGGYYDPFDGLAADLRSEYAAWLADLAAANSERKEEARRAVAAAHDREVAAAQAERAGWVERHGSTRLKRLVAEGIEHEAVYRAIAASDVGAASNAMREHILVWQNQSEGELHVPNP